MVKWANFVQPKSVKDVIAPTELGPVKQAHGGPIKQAQDDILAKTKQNQTNDSNHLKSQGLSRSCEQGEGLGSHVYAEKSTLGTSEMGGDLSTSNGGFEMLVQEVFVPMGYPGSRAEVGVPSTVSVVNDSVTDCPISGAVEVLCVLNSNGHLSLTDTVDSSNVGCSTMPVKIAEVSCHQPLLEQNHFSPISELVSDSFEEETLLLNWVNPKGSDKDKEDRQLMEYVPLA